MNTLGEIEAAICQGISRFEQEFMGLRPNDIHVHLLGDLLLIRLQSALTGAERHLAQTLSPEEGGGIYSNK